MNLTPQNTQLTAPMRFTLEPAKSNFFDRKKIIDEIGAARAKVTAQQGNFVMKAARRLIRPPPSERVRKKILSGKETNAKDDRDFLIKHASAGNPPYSQTGLLRKFILYAWDSASLTTLIGPVLLTGQNMGTAPATLEYGGPATVPIYSQREGRRIWKDVNLRPRPYMAPALNASLPRLAEIWRDKIK